LIYNVKLTLDGRLLVAVFCYLDYTVKFSSETFQGLTMSNYKTWTLAASLLLATSMPVNAAENKTRAATNVSEYAPVAELLEQCASCHGEKGASTQPEFPILAGQHFYYLYVQLKDFKSGSRKDEVMGPVVADLAKSQMKLLAKYFSEQKWPAIGFRASAKAETVGEKATGAGQCVQCHLGGYEGNSRIPRLSGQHPEYLFKTMSDFKHKLRLNSAAKSSLFISYTDHDIKAMSEYLGGM